MKVVQLSARNPSKTSTLIRGGQTTQHWWRMALQVLRFAIVTGAAIYVVSFLVLVLRDFGFDHMRIAFYFEMAEMGIENDNGFVKSYTFRNLEGDTVTMGALEMYRDPGMRSVRDSFFGALFRSSYLAFLPAVIVGILSLFVFVITGNRVQDDEHIRGAKLVRHDQLKRWSARQWRAYVKKFKGRKKAPRYSIAGVDFPPNAVEAQTSLVGTVGVGKTNAMIEMLLTIRSLGGRAVIYDRTGTFVSKFYDEETDIIINPFDSRSHSWNIFSDVTDVASLTQIAEVMIQSSPNSNDPFWTNAARVVFEYAARKIFTDLGQKAKNRDLLHAIMNIPISELRSLLAGTPGAHFFDEEIEKTSLSIRANLISDLRFLEFLRDDGETFSMREWMNSEEPGFLFLAADAEHAAANRNIISAIAEIGVNALMTRGQATDPRVFFFFDEVPSLNKMPFLLSSLAEIRQYGGAFVLGYQVFSQLESIYGHEGAQTITGTVNNRIVFNTPDAKTASHCSDNLGLSDALERTNSITVGAHEARDGVAFQQNRTERPIVTASEIQSLPQFEAYVRFAYNAPTAKVLFAPIDLPSDELALKPYLGGNFNFGILDDEAPKDETVVLYGEALTPEEIAKLDDKKDVGEQFYVWADANFRCSGEQWFVTRSTPPSEIARFWEHFAAEFKKKVNPSKIKPVALVGNDMMSNHGPGMRQKAVRMTPPWLSRNTKPSPKPPVVGDVAKPEVSQTDTPASKSHKSVDETASKLKGRSLERVKGKVPGSVSHLSTSNVWTSSSAAGQEKAEESQLSKKAKKQQAPSVVKAKAGSR